MGKRPSVGSLGFGVFGWGGVQARGAVLWRLITLAYLDDARLQYVQVTYHLSLFNVTLLHVIASKRDDVTLYVHVFLLFKVLHVKFISDGLAPSKQPTDGN